jgi:hypothetical protein
LDLRVYKQQQTVRELDTKELQGLYSSPNITRVSKSWRMRWAGHVAIIVKSSAPYRILVGKPPERRSLAKPRLTLENNIKMVVKAIEWEGVIWVSMGTGAGNLWTR